MNNFDIHRTPDSDFEGRAGGAYFYINSYGACKVSVWYNMSFSRFFRKLNILNDGNLYFFGEYKNLNDAERALKYTFCGDIFVKMVTLPVQFLKSFIYETKYKIPYLYR